MQSKIPLYPYGAKEARERGEIEKWRESFRENCACAGGIDILILENFDGIGLNDGSDLFEKRLHIRENVEQVTFLPHDEWNNGDAVSRRTLDGVSGDQWDAFVDALCSAPVERISYEEHPDFYDAAVQGHVYVEKQDGTQIELRLLEGGYVGYQRLGWIFVEMPGDLFDAVLSACQ